MKAAGKIFVLLLIICSPELSFSQNFNGIRTSNFDGVQNIMLNPASAVDNKTYLDINLFSGQLFFRNNFLYIPENDFHATNYLFNTTNIPRYDSSVIFPKKAPFNYYYNEKLPEFYGQLNMMGPSFNLSLKKQSFSFFTSYKSAIYSDVPTDIMRVALEGFSSVINYDETYMLQEINSGLLFWSEIGVGYATILNPLKNNNWYAGANIKFLSGYSGGYFNKTDSYYSISRKPVYTLHSIDINMGSTHSLQFKKPSGYGLGMDIGIHYIKRGNSRPTEYYTDISRQSYGDYKYKLGFSIIDLGRIRFTKNSTKFSLQSDSLILIEGLEQYENIPLDSIDEYILNDIQNKIYEIIPTADVDNRFYYSLPTKLSFQFDYHIKSNWYVNAILMAGIRTKNSHIESPAQLTICPRYESRDIELWFPFTYNTFYKSQFGLILRYRFLIIGTENLFRHFENRDFTGTDFFVSLNLPLAREKFRRHLKLK